MLMAAPPAASSSLPASPGLCQLPGRGSTAPSAAHIHRKVAAVPYLRRAARARVCCARAGGIDHLPAAALQAAPAQSRVAASPAGAHSSGHGSRLTGPRLQQRGGARLVGAGVHRSPGTQEVHKPLEGGSAEDHPLGTMVDPAPHQNIMEPQVVAGRRPRLAGPA